MLKHSHLEVGDLSLLKEQTVSPREKEGTDEGLLPFPDAPINIDHNSGSDNDVFFIPWTNTQVADHEVLQPCPDLRTIGLTSGSVVSLQSTMTRMDESQVSPVDMKVPDVKIRKVFPVLQHVANLALEKVNAVVVGDVALRAFGLDQDVGDTVQVAVKDAHIDQAKNYLLDRGYVEEEIYIDTDSVSTHRILSTGSDMLIDGAYRLVRQTAAGPLNLILSHATVWNLSLGAEYKRSVQMLPYTQIPFPKFNVYLKAVLRTAAGLYRGRSAATLHYATHGIDDAAKKLLAICPPEIKASLKTADRFMAKYFPCPNKTRDWENYVCAQAIRIYLGEITVSDAEQRMPRVKSVMQVLEESTSKTAEHKRFWKRTPSVTEAAGSDTGAAVFTLIEPRTSINSRHRVIYRLRNVFDKIHRERRLRMADMNSSSAA
ncbi:hypothetical protein KEM54_000523 [Ascosphaera aggregata]|nr:hypothetical protein KEM54_000523 [Ascosphaera aggregata]